MIGQEVSVRKIEWPEVAAAIKCELKKMLGKEIDCIAGQEDYDYWGIRFQNYRMPIAEVELLLSILEADGETRDESIPLPEDKENAVKSIGMNMARELLKRFLNCTWLYEFLNEKAIYLIEISELEKIKNSQELQV